MLKLELPRYIRIRRRRPDTVEEDRSDSQGIAVVGGPDYPTPTLNSRPLPTPAIDSASANRLSDLAVSTRTPQPPTTQSSPNPFGRQAIDAANLVLPVASTIAGAIPIVGSPIQAGISGLLQILNVVDVRVILVPTFLETKSTQILQQVGQNKEDIQELKSKLDDLNNQISTIQAAGPDFDKLRDRLTQYVSGIVIRTDAPRF